MSGTARRAAAAVLTVVGILSVSVCGAAGTTCTAAAVEPPAVVLRDIARAPRIARGETIDLDTSRTLFLPEGWLDTLTTPGAGIRLTLHYHGAQWYAIEEHARRGARNPMLAQYLGEGSRVYQAPYLEQARLRDELASVSAELRRRGAPPGAAVTELEIQSFSAGYGAVREILKSPDYVSMIRAVVLADSLYASLTTDTEGRRVPDPGQMAPFISFARQAANGERLMVVAHSSIPTANYCSTVETADAIVQALDLVREEVRPGSIPAADAALEFRLVSRAEAGRLHIWGYAGATPQAHMAVARTIADFWRAADP
ncbi:MAG: hypothetical protein N2111_03125 [Candidatus Sumerlaeaceae bacterium]|nr:hypothetical protein [Candidatus Sumerlaeaceae bacterium]